jgi:OmcA/MtrC family decaheme c-type cytochrome
MRRISLALALVGAMAATGCGAGGAPAGSSGKAPGIAEGTFKVTVQNTAPLQIQDGYVTSSPAGIDCGGATRTACEADFPIGQAVTMTATALNGKSFLQWAGDCQGTSCVLTGNSDKYLVASFGTYLEQGSHPNWSKASDHGREFWAFENGQAGGLDCRACHGANLQGQGIAVSCQSCHSKSVGATVAYGPAEGCRKCHAAGTYGAPKDPHKATGHVVVSNAAATTVDTNADGTADDVVLTFNVKVDGVNSNALTFFTRAYRFAYNSAREGATVLAAFERFTVAIGTGATLGTPVNGNYTVTFPGMAATVGSAKTTFMVALADRDPALEDMNTTWATAVAHVNGAARDLVGDQACKNCHGDYVFRHREDNGELHHGANPAGVEACVVCHTRYGSVSRGMGGDRTMAYVHGIHNSHAMPAGTVGTAPNTVAKPAGVYARNNSASSSSWFSIGFPGYMVNCSTCHDTDARLAATLARPVKFATCMSCHDGWDGFDAEPADHAPYTAATNCASCHGTGGTAAAKSIADFHDGMRTDRSGLVWAGKDQSVEEAKKIKLSITGVSIAAGEMTITWKAVNPAAGNAEYDPCNTDIASGPVFFGVTADAASGRTAHSMSVVRAYAQGNDWVNAGVGTSPGQPGASVNLSGTNTTCTANVATTKIPTETTTATKGLVTFQGRPQVLVGTTGLATFVRAEAPTREFLVADGAAPATKRRAIVSNAKCLACHLGSLYQHSATGGTRVDNVDLCVACHNPAANDKNWRTLYGVTAANSYDGKSAETYDMRVMIHAIHSAGEKAPWVLYRGSNGVYAFGSQDAIDGLRNWPGAGSNLVYPGTYGTARSHNEIVVHYPRELSDCGACHVDGFDQFAGQATAMPVTVDAGTLSPVPGGYAGTNAFWGTQTDDQLMGPAAASCFSCHQSRDAITQASLRQHAYGFGWTPASFTGGRQALIDYVTLQP